MKVMAVRKRHLIYICSAIFFSILVHSCGGSGTLRYEIPGGVSYEELRYAWPDGSKTISGRLYHRGAFDKLVIIVGAGGPNRMHVHGGLMDSLLSRGVAVLSYDERGVGASTGSFGEAGYFDLAADLTLIARNLRRSYGPGVSIGAVGVRDGGWKAMVAANYDKRLEYLVLVGTPPVRGAEWYEMEAAADPGAFRFRREGPDETVAMLKAYHRAVQATRPGPAQWEALRAHLDAVAVSRKRERALLDPLYVSGVRLDPGQYVGKNAAAMLAVLDSGAALVRSGVSEEAWQLLGQQGTGVETTVADKLFEDGDEKRLAGRVSGAIADWVRDFEPRR